MLEILPKEKTVCFTGHRKLPSGNQLELLKQSLNAEIFKAIEAGYTTFLFGGALGWDMLCASIVASYKYANNSLNLIAVLPFAEHWEKWEQSERNRCSIILSKCDEVITLQLSYQSNCYKNRNQYMVDNSQQVICYFNGDSRTGTGQTVAMAKRKSLDIVNLYK